MKSTHSRNWKWLVVSLVVSLAVVPSTALAGGKGKGKGKGKKKAAVERITGGGSVFTGSGMRVTHGFELRCDANDARQNLEVNWEGNRFHLLDVTRAQCTDDPNIDSRPPRSSRSDTYVGEGTGRYNGQSGATAQWTFTDAGEPGTSDTATITVRFGGNVVLTVSGPLNKGNHQFHAR